MFVSQLFCSRVPPACLNIFSALNFLTAGGLDENVNEAVLHAAFLPFGEVKDVNIPLDQLTQKNRGFGFVTFMEKCEGR